MRVIALFLALAMSLGIIYPIASDYSEARSKNHHKSKKFKKHKKKKIKKYSRAWWRRYHKRMKRKKLLAARKRALQKRRLMFAKAKRKPLHRKPSHVAKKKRTVRLKQINKTGDDAAVAKAPVSKKAPKGQSPSRKNGREKVEASYSVESSEGNSVGNAQLSVFGLAGVDVDGGNAKTVGGVATNVLRRSVIDRMLREGGWVVNDFQKELNGKKVYVVIAQSPGADGRVNSRTYYFTEAGGKIYSLATTAPSDSVEEVAAESEKLLIGLHRGNYPTQANLK